MPQDILDEYNGVLDARYYVPQYTLAAPTSIQTANQLAEVTARLNAGVYGVDLALINPEIFEQVPKAHMKEIDRLVKLSGAKASVHGPIVDLAGFQQGRWNEHTREEVERKLAYYVDRAHDLDTDGNVPINFHINTNVPGDHWHKLNERELDELKIKAEKLSERERSYIQPYIDRGEIKESVGFIDLETGQVNAVPYEVKHYPGGDVFYTPDRRLKIQNETQWDQDRLRIFEFQRQKAMVEDRMNKQALEILPYEYGKRHGVKLTEREKVDYERNKRDIEVLDGHIKELNTHIYSGLNDLYHKFSYLPESEKKKAESFLKEVKEEYKEYEEEIRESELKRHEIFERLEREGVKELHPSDARRIQELATKSQGLLDEQHKLLQSRLNAVGRPETGIPTPSRFVPTNQIAKEKTIETISNTAFDAYKKYKENTPIITIENYWYNLTLGSASELKDVIQESRNKFADMLVKKEGIDRETAKETADKLIGVTWDVGHINMMRSGGYDEKKVLEETKIIAPVVKQLHITDNFGFNDSHLPPGMGNAPINKEIEELKKHGFKFEKGNIIVEAGAFPQQFGENPHGYALEYFKSPLYSLPTKVPAYWHNIWETQGPYSLGYGEILPDIHFRELYGAGFTNLPPELGGQTRFTDRGRFASSPGQ